MPSGPGIDSENASDVGFAISDLTVDRAVSFGEEAREIARLLASSVRGFEGRVTSIRTDSTTDFERLVRDGLAQTGAVAVRPFFPTTGAARAFADSVSVSLDVRSEADLDLLAPALRRSLDERAVRVAFGGSRHVPVRVIPVDADSYGEATSCDPIDGHPDHVGVRRATGEWYRVERKSGRTAHEGSGLDSLLVESIADLVDRCQIELGRPLVLHWATHRGRVVALSIEPLKPSVSFAHAALRRVAIVAADEGTVAPLAIDALDRGLTRTRERVPGAIASRVYARPYRRLEIDGRLLGAPMGPVASATSAAAKVAYETAVAFHADTEFCKSSGERVRAFSAEDLAAMDDEALLAAFEARHGFVADAFARLDGCRELTRRAILALETAVGPLPREAYPALSTPKSTKERVRIGIDLGDLARRIGGDLREPGLRKRLDPPHAKRWDELRASLEDTRPLGIDIVPEPIGATDETFQAALVAAPPRRRIDALEEARWSAIRRVLALAQNQPFGAARAGVVSSVSLVIERIVASKGRLAEVLADALFVLRTAALELGTRLVDRALLDAAADAFYLTQEELEEALRGEPSGLSARVRARREDDARWRWFDAPRRLLDEES